VKLGTYERLPNSETGTGRLGTPLRNMPPTYRRTWGDRTDGEELANSEMGKEKETRGKTETRSSLTVCYTTARVSAVSQL